MNKIKIGFIGTGYMANEYAKVFKKIKKPRIKLVGAINKSGLNIDKFLNLYKIRQKFKTIDELIINTRPDLLVVAVNELSMLTVMKTISKYPCVALIEKPLGINFEENKKILNLRKNENFHAFLGMNRRKYSSVISAQKLLKLDSSRRIITINDQENTLKAIDGGQPQKVVKNWMYANSIHMIDFCKIFGRGRLKKIIKISEKNFLKQNFLSRKIIFSSGDVIYYNCLWNRPGPWSLSISTKKFYIELKPIEKLRYISSHNRIWQELPISKEDKIFKPGLYLQIKELINFIKSKKSNLENIKKSSDLMKLIKDIYFG